MKAKVTHSAIEATEDGVDGVIESVKKLPGVVEDEIIVARLRETPNRFVVVFPV